MIPEGSLGDEVLKELYGLEIPALERRGEYIPNCISFDPLLAWTVEDDIQELAALLKVRLCPIGIAGRSMAFILLADTGHLLLMGIAEFGVLLEGNSLEAGMSRILHGESGDSLLFSEAPESRLASVHLTAPGKEPIAIGPEGIRGISGR